MNAPKTVEDVHMNAPTIALTDAYHHALESVLRRVQDRALINVMALALAC